MIEPICCTGIELNRVAMPKRERQRAGTRRRARDARRLRWLRFERMDD
ncbi:MAG: hypothetical protein ABL934_18520 [Lysobacteraceae bacterium]